MSDEQQKPEVHPDVAATAPEGADAAAEAASTDEAHAARKGSGRWWALLFVLVVLAGLGALAYRYVMQHPDRFGLSTQSEPSPSTAPANEPAPTAAPQPVQGQTAAAQAQTQAVQTPLSSQDAEQLMATMNALQQQLQQLHTDNAELRRTLAEQQHSDLRSRLTLIADPDTRLKQLSLLWQDVSLSPVLSAQQRSEAVSMTAAAREALTQNQLWQQRLDTWIATLAGPESGPDLIPHFAHPWLEWLAEQFHLRPAPTNDSSGSQALREKLMQIRRGMTIETWPDTKDWQPIRAELILIHASSAKTDADKAAGIGLPNDFTAMRKAVATLHETARQWLEAKP